LAGEAVSLFTNFDDMNFPQPGEELSAVEWSLRYGQPTKEQLGVAASVISAYSGLVLRKTQKERNYVCGKLREAVKWVKP
jgi:hypothetical protein